LEFVNGQHLHVFQEEWVSLRLLRYFCNMTPVLWSFVKDMIFEEMSLEEIWTNYLFGKANAYDRANLLENAIKVYEEILRGDPNSIPVFLNLGAFFTGEENMKKRLFIMKG